MAVSADRIDGEVMHAQALARQAGDLHARARDALSSARAVCDGARTARAWARTLLSEYETQEDQQERRGSTR
jgi:hypothetical protein